jgi:ABC-type multidrug transport system ATPase subunit
MQIETRDLHKRFKEVHAVNGLNMKVPKGKIFGFLGPNGAGKTTTIKMMMGLSRPSVGEVLIGGERSTKDSVEIRRKIGYLPERVEFYENLTPLQTLEFFCELKDVDPREAQRLVKEVGLEEAKNRRVGTFSKGMVQLLGVAQAMIGNPSLYILDEPMGGLDARWVKTVRERIRELNRNGATIMFSSHILSEVQVLCDRVAIINRGELVAQDTIANISGKLHMEPRLEVKIPGRRGKVPKGVRKIKGVKEVSAEGAILYVTCGSKVRAKVIDHLSHLDLEIEDFRTTEPSLEDAFVKLIEKEEGE